MRGAWVLALLAVGCAEVERGVGVFPERDAVGFDGGLISDGGRGDASMATAELEDPVGTWAVFIEDRKCLSAVGAKVENIIWSWFRVEVVDARAPDDTGVRVLRQTGELCTQELSPLIGGLRTIVPDAVVNALDVQPWGAFLQGSAAGSGYLTSEWLDLWGAEGVSPGEPVPSEVDDPRVIDLDGDGNPGVSFVVGNAAGGEACRVFVVQRTKYEMTGVVVDSSRIEGAVDSVIEQNVLDSTSPLCGGSNEYVVSPSPSRFVMIRVDGKGGGLDLDLNDDGTVDCAEIAEGQQILMGGGMVQRVDPDNEVCRQ
ncbi:MAG: hypothetical protein KC613_10700 [Myxococcales bacterium]|nr:hypothetical protein [Myxococcales bacterium]